MMRLLADDLAVRNSEPRDDGDQLIFLNATCERIS